jgi:hypothetical protein
MRSSDFKRHSATLRTLQEEPLKKKVNWDRIIYIAILLIIAFFVLKFFVLKLFLIRADGQVRFNKLDVMFTHDVQVLKYYVEPGDEIQIGDTLFEFVIDENINDGGIHSGTGGSVSTDINLLKEDTKWAERERLLTLKKIESNEIDKRFKQELIGQLTTQIEGLKKEIYLNIHTSEKLSPLYAKKAELEAEIKGIISENKFLYSYLSLLQSDGPAEIDINTIGNPNNQALGGLGVGDNSNLNYYISPINGTITQIFIEQFEVALESQQVLSMHQPEGIYVRGYFKQSDLDEFKEGDEVTIKFPDGTNSTGVIKHIYFASYTMPEEFQKKYEPVTRVIASDIYPLNDEELKKWKKYYKIGVKIIKPRFW